MFHDKLTDNFFRVWHSYISNADGSALGYTTTNARLETHKSRFVPCADAYARRSNVIIIIRAIAFKWY